MAAPLQKSSTRCGRPDWMTPETAYGHARLVARFESFRHEVPPRPLAETVQVWVRALPVSQQAIAKIALRHHLGRTALDWGAIETARYHRDDGALAASVLKDDQRARLWALATPRDRALIGCLFSVRRAEACAMRWIDVDLSSGMVMVPKGKGGKSAWTLLVPSAQTDLAEWFEAAGTPDDLAPVFPTPKGRHYTPGALGRVVQKLLARAGLWAPGRGAAHRFRRTLATCYLREHPGDLVGLQAILRHEQVSTTARYAWLTRDDLAPRLAKVRL